MVSMVAKNIKERRQIKALADIFENADSTGNGKITIEEYMHVCQDYGIELTEKEMENIQVMADINGEIATGDLIHYVKSSNLSKAFDSADQDSDFQWKKKVDLAWKLFDKNMDGYISKLEFSRIASREKLNRNQIDLMFKRCDTNGDGRLDYQEFTDMILRNRERKERARAEQEEKERKAKIRRERKWQGLPPESEDEEDEVNVNEESFRKEKIYNYLHHLEVSGQEYPEMHLPNVSNNQMKNQDITTDDEIDEELENFEQADDNSEIQEDIRIDGERESTYEKLYEIKEDFDTFRRRAMYIGNSYSDSSKALRPQFS